MGESIWNYGEKLNCMVISNWCPLLTTILWSLSRPYQFACLGYVLFFRLSPCENLFCLDRGSSHYLERMHWILIFYFHDFKITINLYFVAFFPCPFILVVWFEDLSDCEIFIHMLSLGMFGRAPLHQLHLFSAPLHYTLEKYGAAQSFWLAGWLQL